jgi:hypothetical protein
MIDKIAIAKQIRAISTYLDWREQTDDEDETPYCPVRLQVLDGEAIVHFGDASYDLDHRGYWGYGSITPDCDFEQLAQELIEQVEYDREICREIEDG